MREAIRSGSLVGVISFAILAGFGIFPNHQMAIAFIATCGFVFLLTFVRRRSS